MDWYRSIHPGILRVHTVPILGDTMKTVVKLLSYTDVVSPPTTKRWILIDISIRHEPENVLDGHCVCIDYITVRYPVYDKDHYIRLVEKEDKRSLGHTLSGVVAAEIKRFLPYT
jgi:hypothetical protein